MFKKIDTHNVLLYLIILFCNIFDVYMMDNHKNKMHSITIAPILSIIFSFTYDELPNILRNLVLINKEITNMIIKKQEKKEQKKREKKEELIKREKQKKPEKKLIKREKQKEQEYIIFDSIKLYLYEKKHKNLKQINNILLRLRWKSLLYHIDCPNLFPLEDLIYNKKKIKIFYNQRYQYDCISENTKEKLILYSKINELYLEINCSTSEIMNTNMNEHLKQYKNVVNKIITFGKISPPKDISKNIKQLIDLKLPYNDLCICNSIITPDIVELFSELPLEKIDLNKNVTFVKNTFCSFLKNIGKNRMIKCLSLNNSIEDLSLTKSQQKNFKFTEEHFNLIKDLPLIKLTLDSHFINFQGFTYFFNNSAGNIKQLILCHTKFGNEDIKYLQKLQLDELDISFTKVTDLKNFKSFTSITSINFDECKIIKFEGLENMVNIKKLGLCKTSFSDFKCLSKLVNLTELDISHTKVKDLNGIEKLKNLGILDAFGTLISCVRPLKKLKNLYKLDLGCSGITNLNFYDKFDIRHVRSLHVGACEITEKSLEKLLKSDISINYLVISKCRLSDHALKLLNDTKKEKIENVTYW